MARQKTQQAHKQKNKRRINSSRLKKEGTLGLDQIQRNILNNIIPIDDEFNKESKYYCIECDRFFISDNALSTHKKSKVHKKRVKELGDVIHTQKHAEMAVGLF
ncbi:bud site selection [Vairimorpha apis BRL 01]|uniref:Bud site selection n=1 Tax=Vairimorpha apis BRL 01 TaxID=1037528 RepID=T0MFL5_9MICR|nr:bud site selection [Vairimorpha apis BRL 01]